MASSPRINSKLPDIGVSIFAVMGGLAAAHGAIDLSQGAPNFACNPALAELAAQAMREGHNQYSEMAGDMTLREQLADNVERLHGHRYHPQSEITITGSASEGLYASISALVHAGDEVIYFEPAFDSYAPTERLQGATPVAIKLDAPAFRVDFDAVAAAITPRTRMIIVNTPHNPTATVWSPLDLQRLARLLRDSNIVVLSDEVYEHVVFDGATHHGMAGVPELAERSVVVSSFGKSFHVTGWRVGYCLAPVELTREIRKVHQFLMFSADTPMQRAFAVWLKTPEHYLELGNMYQQKRDRLASLLATSRFELLPSAGSFFMLAGYGHFCDQGDAAFVRQLIVDHGVATLPLSAFYADGTDDHIIRLSFAKDEQTLRAGAACLCKVGA